VTFFIDFEKGEKDAGNATAMKDLNTGTPAAADNANDAADTIDI